MKGFFRNYISTFILSILVVLSWEVYSRNFTSSMLFLPAPSTIFQAFTNSWDIILFHAWQTIIETVVGLMIAIVLGLTLAILLSQSSVLKKTIYPLLIVSQTIPMIALAPLLLLWFGFDLTPKVIVVVLYCFFPIIISCFDGLTYVESDLINLLKSMNASQWQIIKFVRLPSALPAFFSGLKIASTYAVTGAIVGEFVGAYRGLGIFMQTSAHSHAFSLVFAAIIVVSFLSIILVGLVSILEHIFVYWER